MTFRTPATMFFIVTKVTTTCTAEYEFCCPTLTTVCRLNELPVQKKKSDHSKTKNEFNETCWEEMCRVWHFRQNTEEWRPWLELWNVPLACLVSFPAGPLKLTIPDTYDAYDCKNETAADSTVKATVKNTSV